MTSAWFGSSSMRGTSLSMPGTPSGGVEEQADTAGIAVGCGVAGSSFPLKSRTSKPLRCTARSTGGANDSRTRIHHDALQPGTACAEFLCHEPNGPARPEHCQVPISGRPRHDGLATRRIWAEYLGRATIPAATLVWTIAKQHSASSRRTENNGPASNLHPQSSPASESLRAQLAAAGHVGTLFEIAQACTDQADADAETLARVTLSDMLEICV